MVKVKFKFKDAHTNGQWREQECSCHSLEECKRFYGLGIDPTCEYEILSVTGEDEK